ncbi:MAG: hypothetical protein IKS55_08540 [Oscillospiraceae bacterium]|nr:hypothetical protein [Oscillospiraceae bacterium]
MLETLIIVLILLMLLPSKGRKAKKKKKSRPWYDISYDDMIMYDIFDDD